MMPVHEDFLTAQPFVPETQAHLIDLSGKVVEGPVLRQVTSTLPVKIATRAPITLFHSDIGVAAHFQEFCIVCSYFFVHVVQSEVGINCGPPDLTSPFE